MGRRQEVGTDTGAVDQATFDAFYREHYAPMVRLARLLTGSVAEAEDLTHDAFVRVAPRLDSLERPAAYLRTAVVNACRSHHRHQAVVERLAPAAGEVATADHLVEFEDALARLPERQRDAIVLRYYADLDDADIAELLGCRRATVRTLVRRGMAALREVIER